MSSNNQLVVENNNNTTTTANNTVNNTTHGTKESESSCSILPKSIINLLNQYNLTIQYVEQLKSAQQCVFILSITASTKENQNNNSVLSSLSSPSYKEIFQALKEGNNKLIVRIWKGSARWWNMNSTQLQQPQQQQGDNNEFTAVVQLAQAEVSGYRVARRAFEKNRMNCSKNVIIIPHVLFFSHEYRTTNKNLYKHMLLNDYKELECCWAIFSYVGSQSTFFTALSTTTSNTTTTTYQCDDQQQQDTNNNNFIIYNSKFSSSMVKIRHEFGFDEPHPRHGRVCEENSLAYALDIIKYVVLPIHGSFFNQSFFNNNDDDDDATIESDLNALCCNNNIICTSTTKKDKTIGDGDCRKPWCYHTMLDVYDKILSQIHKDTIITLETTKNNNSDEQNSIIIKQWKIIIEIAMECLQHLIQYESKEIYPLEQPVLCHLDMQPQNLLFYNSITSSSSYTNKIPDVRCVLDWEEAAYADARFELLLICRKVCANDAQANTIWNYYQQQLLELYPTTTSIGSIDPWLKLETLHSIITLVLQGRNMGGRGHAQWEKQCDLFSKIDREVKRLVFRGWDFCNRCSSIIVE